MSKTLKKTLSIIVAILMIVTSVPMAFAAEDLTDDITSVTLKDTDNDGYYEIATADELKAFANLVNAGNTAINVELTSDIVLNENVITEDGQLSDNSESFEVWVPIGNSDVIYTGVFDGARHVISGLYYKGNGEFAGLFGAIDGKYQDKSVGAIRDLYLIDSYFDIESSDRWFRVGGLAGYSYYAHFDNCYVEAQFNLISTYHSPHISVGGISGLTYSTAENCFSDLGVSITKHTNASAPWVGGIFGDASSTSVIINCHTNYDSVSTGNPTITNSTASRTAEEFENGTLCSLVGFHPCESTEGKDATCTEAGYAAYEYCTVCDYTTYEEIHALGHVFSTSGICDVCGEVCVHESCTDGKCDDCGQFVWMVTLKLTDSYGDGWNDNAIRLVAGENIIGEYTIDTGENAEYSFVIEKGMYSFQWVEGDYAYECSFEIIVDGVTVVTVMESQYEDVETGYEILNTYNLCEHKDEDDDHDCDICGGTIYCADENKDHICDVGNEELACVDADNDHLCDFGGEEFSQCADEDNDHNCDICGKVLSEYTDTDKNHECDICGKNSRCVDKDEDSFCDICEKYMDAGVKVELEYVDDYAYPNDIYTAFTNEEPENLFDGNNFNKLCIKFGETIFSEGCDYYTVEFKTADGSEICVAKYDFVTANDESQRDPKSWKLYGSDDGESWTLIDERTDENLTQERNATESFYIYSADEAYSYFKLEIHMVRDEYYIDVNWGDWNNPLFQLSELSLYKAHAHSWADGKCEICRIECEHKSNTDNICDTCGKSLHTCDFSGEWFYDSEKHWKKCECSLVDVEAAHSYTEGVCDVCGYECTHAEQTGAECEICGKILHTHNYEYTASGNTITATCTASGTCDAPDGGYLKLVVPTKYSWKQYSATAKEIEVENTIADISYEVDYCCDGGCINAGSHTASVTLGGATATVGFEIEKYYVSQASLIMSTRTKVYDGTTDAPGEINALKFYMATGSEIINLPADGYQATVRYETPEVGDRKVIWQWVKVTDKEAMKNYKFGYNDFENGLNSDFSITKRPITVTPEANEVLIGNQPNAGNKVIVGGDYGLADNQTITVTYQHIDSSAVGEKELIIDTVTILDANGNDVTSNYEITTVNGICDVVECPHETYTDGVCDICGYSCEHESYTEGVCDVCGYECPHEDTYNNLIRPVQNADGTWGKGKVVEICNICGNSSLVQEVERDHEGYKVFDETAAELEAILNSGKMTDTWKNDYTNRLNGLRNSAYYQVYTEIETAIPSMTESLKSIIAEIEAGIADGTMIKADFTYMTSLFDEINALIDNDPNKLIPSESGRFQGIYYGYYMSCKNNGNHSQADYDQNMADNNWEGQIEDILAGVKDGTALKADYTEIDEAIAALDEKLADVNLTDEAKTELEDIKAQLNEMKLNPLSSKADVEELMKAVEELEAGIEDGSAVKVNGISEINKYIISIEKEIIEKYGVEEYQRISDSLSDDIKAEIMDIINEAEGIEGSVKDNEEKLNELKARVEVICAKIENCLAGEHNGLDYVVIEEAKCEVNAIESATCTLCGEVLTKEVENSALTHTFTKYEVTEEAKCGVEGKEVAYCDNGCGATDEKAIEALRHSFTKYEVVEAPACGKAGKEVAACDNGCGATDEKEIEALRHSFTKYEVVDAPACGVEGKEVAICDNGCNETDERAIDALKHSFSEYTYNEDATCTADGTKTAACDHNCGATDIVTAEGTMLTHTDADGDYKCDNGCGHEFEKPAPEEPTPDTPDEPTDEVCDHLCHKGGFIGFIWKIVKFFSKLFKINPICECGVAHY